MIVFIQIGNSDDKLTQREWAQFIEDVRSSFEETGNIIGEWHSRPDTPWQNACWMYDVPDDYLWHPKKRLQTLCTRYRQDSIAWTEAPETEFLTSPVGARHE